MESRSEIEQAMLVERCKGGDMWAWDRLVRMYEETVYRFAFALCKDRDGAEHIAGDAFVHVFNTLHTFRHEACFLSWLFEIVSDTAVKLGRIDARLSNISA